MKNMLDEAWGVCYYNTRFVGQAVKTPPSHGGNTGSIPVRTAKYLKPVHSWKHDVPAFSLYIFICGRAIYEQLQLRDRTQLACFYYKSMV